MLSLRSRKLALTLFCTLALALALVGPTQAADPFAVNRRDHGSLNRMIKKRTPGLLDDLNPVNNAGTGSADDSSAASGSDSAAAASSTAPASDTAASASATTPASSAAASSDTASSTTPASSDSASSTTASTTTTSSASTTSSTTSSTTTSSTTSSSSSTSAVATSTTAAPTSAAASPTSAAAVEAQDNSAQAVTITSHVSVSASPTSSATAKAAASSSTLSKGAITTLAVIAGCIGGGALIWTIFRKWKLRTSKRFDDRLAPIDWQPPTDGDDVPGSNRRASIASSFHSAGHDGLVRAPSSSSSHGAYGAYGATGQHAPTLQPLPEHDFTAGPATGAYLGANAGYADLARGPSPGPQMQDLSRGPSFNHGYNGYPQQAPAGAYDYNNAHY
ncbi:unnamed protein product [Peniophora sp. CBMAI 1063]|nr:unnamed protein product [Peniophora sp. CBMAI 1063]